MLFDSWHSMLHVATRAAIAYLVIVAGLRVIGEQALAKMSAYDLIVTITLGSVVAEIPFAQHIAVVDGIAIMITFVLLQEVIRWAQARSKAARRLVAEKPRLVVWEGHVLDDRVQKWRLTVDEIRAAVRRAGLAGISDVQAVVLENDGEWSVVRRRDCGADRSAFEGLDVPDQTAG
ncbi:MAG TPA: YetF domain-containing protein [Kofleriaceae bacterium]